MRTKFVPWAVASFVIVCAATLAYGQSCLTIQSGLLKDVNGNTITMGYDAWGYNYQAHAFNGLLGNYTRPTPPLTEDNCATGPMGADGCINLQMKWNDAWLSNKSCDGDDKLDRYFGFTSYIGSGAWLTNHLSSSYSVLVNGMNKQATWTDFIKIVAVPADATCNTAKPSIYGDNCTWVGSDGVEIGPSIWGQFAVIQEVYNDPFAGLHGNLYKSPAGPGLGIYGTNP